MKGIIFFSVMVLGVLAAHYGGGSSAGQRPVNETPVPSPAAFPPLLAPSLTPGPGKIYYVDPEGDDSNPGTSAQPWRSIGAAAARLSAGDSVLIKGGVYRERVQPQQSGAAGAYITYAAFPGHTVVIDGEGIRIGNFAGLFDLSGRSHIRVHGLTMRHASGVALFATEAEELILDGNHTLNSGSSGIGVWYSKNILIAGNDVENSGSNGANESITVAGVDGFEVRDNHVHNEAPGYIKEGIDVKEGSSHGRVYRNDVHHTRAVGIYVDAYNRHTHDIEVFENAVHNTEASGFALASEAGGLLERVRLYNNLAYNNEHCGITVWGQEETGPHPMRDIQIVDNTVYRNGWGGCGVGIKVSNPDAEGVVVRGNILGENTPLQIQVGGSVPRGALTLDGNVVDQDASRLLGAGSLASDLWFWDPSVERFRLRKDAAAVE